MMHVIPESHIHQDTILIENISRQDSSALSELYDKHSTLLFSVIIRIVNDKKDAEDTLQRVFLDMWERTELYDKRFGHPLAWLCRISRDRAIERIRIQDNRSYSKESEKKSYHNLFTSDVNNIPDRSAMLSPQQEDIFIALTSLSSEQKEMVEFAYFRGYTQTELAEYFNIPLNIIKTRIRSAMTILRQKLRHHLI